MIGDCGSDRISRVNRSSTTADRVRNRNSHRVTTIGGDRRSPSLRARNLRSPSLRSHSRSSHNGCGATSDTVDWSIIRDDLATGCRATSRSARSTKHWQTRSAALLAHQVRGYPADECECQQKHNPFHYFLTYRVKKIELLLVPSGIPVLRACLLISQSFIGSMPVLRMEHCHCRSCLHHPFAAIRTSGSDVYACSNKKKFSGKFKTCLFRIATKTGANRCLEEKRKRLARGCKMLSAIYVPLTTVRPTAP